jgi:SAM-dependent methyltransferase
MGVFMHTADKSWRPRPASVQDLINSWFPPATHPYRILERSLLAHAGPNDIVLEIGCGRSAPLLKTLRGRVGSLIGIDLVDFTIEEPDIRLFNNDIADMKDIADGSVDFAFSRSVMEHVREIDRCYAELHRILKPGGLYVFLTPNFWDYGSLISHFTPNRFHQRIVRYAEGRAEENTFPTFYRSNTRRSIERLAKAHDFHVKTFDYLGQYPAYLTLSRPLFVLGSAYEKTLARFTPLHWLRGWILAAIEKRRQGPCQPGDARHRGRRGRPLESHLMRKPY